MSAFEEWLKDAPEVLVEVASPKASLDAQMEAMRRLMQALYLDGWNRYGWPEQVGGLGGTIYHRAAMWEALARHGVPRMCAFEHLEVLGPALLALGPLDFVARSLPRLLDGSEVWAQGFSEPNAGSDLAHLKTRAVFADDGYVVTGRKIWTSWARFGKWCLVLARTGTTESRHRGITAFAVDLSAPGVEVRSILQADGNDELAEVTFDEVYVPADRIIGEVNGGWQVAMHILSHERGTFAWFRQCFLNSHLQAHGPFATEAADGALAEALLDLASVSAASAAGLRNQRDGVLLGPRAAFTKLLLSVAEQSLYDWDLSTDTDIAVDPTDDAALEARQSYLFSRIVTIYGGSQQMQLDTIAKQILSLP